MGFGQSTRIKLIPIRYLTALLVGGIMKRLILMLLSCAVIFVSVLTVSAVSGGSMDGVQKEVFIDMTSHFNDIQGSESSNLNKEQKDKEDKEDTTGDIDGPLTNDTQTSEPSSEGMTSDVNNTEEIADNDSETDVTGIGDEADKPIDQIENKNVLPESVTLKFDLLSTVITNNLLIVNKSHLLDNKYVPKGLVNVQANLSNLKVPPKKTGIMLGRDAYSALNDMYAAAFKSGVRDMVLSSGYRSYYEQNVLFSKKVSSLIRGLGKNAAENKASSVVARPGSSEHQTGMAVDVTTRLLLKKSDPLVAEFAGTECGKWMVKESWKFGYLLRYKQDKSKITGIIDEPWHFRFVGSPHAEVMNKYGFCLEEYEAYLKSNSHISFTDISNNQYEIAYVSIPAGARFLNVEADKGSNATVSKITANGFVVTVIKPDADL
jgi:D-alanyl-D-alanine carboxypeptidase